MYDSSNIDYKNTNANRLYEHTRVFEIIVGPMFSGKTTLLIDKYNLLKKTYKCLAINYLHDNRFNKGSTKITSHDNISIDCISIELLSELTKNSEYLSKLHAVDYIFINEAQFFKNLKSWVIFALNKLNKNIILCGLNLDFKREAFGEINALFPFATSIYELTGICYKCTNASLYSHRICKNKEQVLIGGNSDYIPLCNECYERENN
tara:strand:- start:987 stop:1607 length:621 start_codon:yes stop_codon:yes gene_type:complete